MPPWPRILKIYPKHIPRRRLRHVWREQSSTRPERIWPVDVWLDWHHAVGATEWDAAGGIFSRIADINLEVFCENFLIALVNFKGEA